MQLVKQSVQQELTVQSDHRIRLIALWELINQTQDRARPRPVCLAKIINIAVNGAFQT
jgi:hypothetical protein